MATREAVSTESRVEVTPEAIVIRIARAGTGAAVTGAAVTGTAGRTSREAQLAFAARADSYEGLVLWHRFEAVHGLLASYAAELEADPSVDAYTRVYDPLCQTAASYAVAAGVQQFSAERFVEHAVACMERIPAVGRLMRAGHISAAWFRRAVEQTALVEDADLLAFIDAEIAHRLAEMGGLSAKRVEAAVAAIVAEHDPDAATLTREEVKASKRVQVSPITAGMSEVIITASAEDATVCLDVLDAVIAGVCAHDPRTKSARRSDAAMARINGTVFACACGRDDCAAELSDAAVAARCARIVLHVVVRKDTLDGCSQTPAHLDGYGPISAVHVRELAGREDAVQRVLDVDELVGQVSRAGNGYRPSAALDTAVRALFGTCSWTGCSRPAWKCDLDHVTEFNRDDPAVGGATCACNLNPKCKFHHGLKTHGMGWLDDQVVDANGVVWTEITTPEGLVVRQQAANLWLLPELGLIPCSHGSATRPGSGHAGDAPERAKTRREAKHQYRMRQRAANRRRRAELEVAAEATAAARDLSDGEPPF